MSKDFSIQEQEDYIAIAAEDDNGNHHLDCSICYNKILLQETALVKGCEHAFCVTCILRWASMKKEPTCPQCKNPFEFLNIHRALDGSIHDYMFEESVCLLLRASWFKPLVVVEREKEEINYEIDDDYHYDYYQEDDDEELNEAYLGSTSTSSSLSLRIGNRRLSDNGYIRPGKQEARPIHQHQRKKKEENAAADVATTKEVVGRRAKRALKHKAADMAAAAKHEQSSVRLVHK